MAALGASHSLLDGCPASLDPRVDTRIFLEISSFGQLDRSLSSLESLSFLPELK
jgi:hypothetical protein